MMQSSFRAGLISLRLKTTCYPNFSHLSRSFSQVQYKNRNPRVYLEKTDNHTTGVVMHSSSSIVTSASTREPNIRQHLYSCVDVSAAENIGRILAHRCYQCGLLSLFFDTVETPLSNESIKAFYDALVEAGISLDESAEVPAPEPLGIDYDNMTNQEKQSMYPSLIETLRTTPDWDNPRYPYSLRPRAGLEKKRNRYQILNKVRQGMVWDPFYHRMVLPQNKAYWQHELDAQRFKQLEEAPISSTAEITGEEDEPVEKAIPRKWRLQ